MSSEAMSHSINRLFLCQAAVVCGLFLSLVAPGQAEDVRLRYDSRGNVVAIEDAAIAVSLRVDRVAPAYGRSGDSFTVVGAGFSTTPSANQVKINGVTATVSEAAPDYLKATVPGGATSGPLTVTVSGTTVTAAQGFVVLPTTMTSPDVTTSTEIVVDAPALRVNTLANRNALVTFAGQSADLLSFQFPQLDLPSLGSASYQVFSPSGNSIASGTLYETTRTIHLPPLPVTGRYALYFKSTALLRTQVALESDAVITVDGVATSSGTSFRGQSRRLRFAGTAGQNLGFAQTDRSVTPGGSYLLAPTFYKPDGSALASLANLPQTGNYSAILKTDAAATQSSFKAWLSNDLTAALTLTQLTTASVARPGQGYRYTFTGTAGQRLRLATAPATTTAPVNQRVAFYIYKPDGNCLEAACYYVANSSSYFVYELPPLPTSGTYGLLVDINPYDDGSATFSAPFAVSEEASTALTIDGSAVSVATTELGQYIRASFSGTAGQNLGFAYANVSIVPSGAYLEAVTYYAPNGSTIASLTNLPATGTYSILVALSHATAQSNMDLWLSSDTTGTLTAGSAATVSVTRPGQAARYTYAGTAGQLLRLTTSGTTTTAPASQRVAVYVYKPDGSCLLSGCAYYLANTGTGGYSDLPALPTTGTYTFVFDINPYDNANASFSTTATLTVLNP
ncbi:IPT/TIG domain-containing protein [Tahibacter sp. UC22_41]|uniref:IPT/TIG domain-containing protein n=1 Tax=Tahibacter sp. UC22_41 TaxID=3350178 RepID=UPI0036DDA5B2